MYNDFHTPELYETKKESWINKEWEYYKEYLYTCYENHLFEVLNINNPYYLFYPENIPIPNFDLKIKTVSDLIELGYVINIDDAYNYFKNNKKTASLKKN